MPVALTYPGVYIEEIPSGVRTITGVATSITAFVGWAPKGPTDRAELVLSWSDYARTFGGLDNRSLLGYSVNQFFGNGGQRAYIVRLVTLGSETADDNAVTAEVTLGADATALTIRAKNYGIWGNNYSIVKKKHPDDAARFSLTVYSHTSDPAVPVESFANLSMLKRDSRYVVNVLKDESDLVDALDITAPEPTPPEDTNPGDAKLAGGRDGKPLVPNQQDGAFEKALLPEPPGDDQPEAVRGGVYLLERVDLFNLLCVPAETTETTIQTLQEFCHAHRAFLIADCNQNATFKALRDHPPNITSGSNAINAAFYFPWLQAPDPLQQGRSREFPPCGFIAGIYARTDSTRGVWKAPAGTEASVTGVLGPTKPLTNDENGVLNPQAFNCIRKFPVYGTVSWGARTLQGNDERGSEWKYVPVRRVALFIEESLYRGTKWVVFEPNDEPLWAQIRLNVGAFMHDLFRQGAFQGKTPQEAYFVKCDKETTTQSDINRGIVNILVGFAPLKPAEFVVIKIQQIAGQIQT